MINPNNLKVWYHRFTNRARGTKSYRSRFDMPGFSKLSRREFRTATEAVAYGHHVVARWKKLYEVAILLMVVPEPAE